MAKLEDNTSFRGMITADDSSEFKAEANRYHLYISLACPWACRTLIMRKLKKLEAIISLSIVDPFLGEKGWMFSDREGCIPDTVNGCHYLSEIYYRANPQYSGRITVPVLWDKKNKTIVNNESSEIIRLFNASFEDFTSGTPDFYPESLRSDIDAINDRVYSNINLGVYKCGFAKTQQDYNVAFDNLFAELDNLEKLLSNNRYLVGQQITEADWRLFSTLIRFDTVYYVHFKCNLRRITDYPHLKNYLHELYQYPGIADTVNFSHIKEHYYLSHKQLNPSGIIPKGPALTLHEPHHRGE